MTLAFDIANSPSSVSSGSSIPSPSSAGRLTEQAQVPDLWSPVMAYRHRLIFRFAVVNLAAIALVAAAWLHGWIDEVIRADDSGLSVVIFGVFLFGLVACTRRICTVTAQINDFEAIVRRGAAPMADSWTAAYLAAAQDRDAGTRSIAAAALKSRLRRSIAVVQHVAGSLVLLGLIGTVIGFVVALAGVDPDRAADVTAITPMVAQLISGMSVALYTTLVGSVLNVWLTVDFRLLSAGAATLLDEIVAVGESHARG